MRRPYHRTNHGASDRIGNGIRGRARPWLQQINVCCFGGAKRSNVAMAIETSANSYHATSASL